MNWLPDYLNDPNLIKDHFLNLQKTKTKATEHHINRCNPSYYYNDNT